MGFLSPEFGDRAGSETWFSLVWLSCLLDSKAFPFAIAMETRYYLSHVLLKEE